MPRLDIDFVRASFPAFTEPLPSKTAFFENAGGSYVAGAVLDKLFHFYRANKVQPYGASEICAAAGEQMDHGRQTIADMLGVSSDCITLGPSTTQNINTLAIACAALLDRDSKIIISNQDHEANIGAWERLCERCGSELVIWEVNPQSSELELDTFRRLLDARVKIVCMTHSSNIIGSINPVEEVIALCRQNGSRVVLDGVSYAPHQIPNLARIQPDAYCFSTYKTYATHLGVMFTSAEFAALLDPQCHYFNRESDQKRLDAAGPDHASIAALVGLGDYFSASYQHHFGESDAEETLVDKTLADKTLAEKTLAVSKLMHQHETDLCTKLLDALASLPLRIIGKTTMKNREANIALISEHHSSAHLSTTLATKNIAAGHGHFYAKRLLDSLNIPNSEDGVLRISFSHYNTEEEVTRLIDALRGVG